MRKKIILTTIFLILLSVVLTIFRGFVFLYVSLTLPIVTYDVEYILFTLYICMTSLLIDFTPP